MVRLERSTSESCWEDDSEMELKKNMGTRGQASLRYQIDSYNKCCLEEEECLLAESVSWRHPYLYFLTPHCFWFQIICMIGLPLTKYVMLLLEFFLSVVKWVIKMLYFMEYLHVYIQIHTNQHTYIIGENGKKVYLFTCSLEQYLLNTQCVSNIVLGAMEILFKHQFTF